MSTYMNVLRRAGAVGVAVGAVLLASAGPAAAQQSVRWTNLVNSSARGATLQKTAGCQGCDDAGAVSQQMIQSGDGYVEFSVGEPYTFWLAGLSRGDGNARFNTIDYAFRFNGNGTADVMEDGQYHGGDVDYEPGDTFRVAVVGGRVQYLQNGQVVMESNRPPRYPLVLKTALGTPGDRSQRADRDEP